MSKTVVFIGTSHRLQGAEKGSCNIDDPATELSLALFPEPIQRSNPNAQVSCDPLPAETLAAQRGNPARQGNRFAECWLPQKVQQPLCGTRRVAANGIAATNPAYIYAFPMVMGYGVMYETAIEQELKPVQSTV